MYRRRVQKSEGKQKVIDKPTNGRNGEFSSSSNRKVRGCGSGCDRLTTECSNLLREPKTEVIISANGDGDGGIWERADGYYVATRCACERALGTGEEKSGDSGAATSDERQMTVGSQSVRSVPLRSNGCSPPRQCGVTNVRVPPLDRERRAPAL